MSKLAFATVALAAVHACPSPAADPQSQPAHYLFSYFVKEGEDGLHLAHSTDGYRWKALCGGRSLLRPEVGREKLIRDPSIVQGPDETFHLVWTAGWHERGIGYSSSRDLVHWTTQASPVMELEPTARNCWAPELFYDDVTNRFLIFWATTIPGRFPETDGQISQMLPPPGSNHRIYVTTTREFKSFTKTELFYNHGFNVIDAAIAKTDKQYVMFLKDETNKPLVPQKNIRVAFADQALGPFGPPSPPITGDYWAEGPSPLRIGEMWFVYFDKYRQKKSGVCVSTDLVHWIDHSDRLEMPDGRKHGTAFSAPASIVQNLLELR